MIIEILITLVIVGGIYLRNLSATVAILERRIKNLESSGASLLISSNPGNPPDYDSDTPSVVSPMATAPVQPALPVASDHSNSIPFVPLSQVDLTQRAVLPPSRPTPFEELTAALEEHPKRQPSVWGQGIETAMSLFKANPFASMGVLLVLIGVGFLFSLLAASNILPPFIRVFLVAAGGAALFGYGLYQESKRPGLAANLQGGGIAIEFLCALWAYHGMGFRRRAYTTGSANCASRHLPHRAQVMEAPSLRCAWLSRSWLRSRTPCAP